MLLSIINCFHNSESLKFNLFLLKRNNIYIFYSQCLLVQFPSIPHIQRLCPSWLVRPVRWLDNWLLRFRRPFYRHTSIVLYHRKLLQLLVLILIICMLGKYAVLMSFSRNQNIIIKLWLCEWNLVFLSKTHAITCKEINIAYILADYKLYDRLINNFLLW